MDDLLRRCYLAGFTSGHSALDSTFTPSDVRLWGSICSLSSTTVRWRRELSKHPLSGFGNVILAVTFVMSAELALASDLRRMTASDQVEMDELRSRQQFLAGVSAELQKPMLEMVTLRSRLDEYTLDGDTHRLIALFDTASERLKSTLSQLVDFERLTRGEVTLQWAPVHLGPMLHDVLEQGHRLTESAGLRFWSMSMWQRIWLFREMRSDCAKSSSI